MDLIDLLYAWTEIPWWIINWVWLLTMVLYLIK